MTQRTRCLGNLRAHRLRIGLTSQFTPEADKTIQAKPESVVARQAHDLRAVAYFGRVPSPATVFIDWLLWLPRGANLRAAAREQIALIDRRASLHPDVQFLRTLLAAVADDCKWRQPFANL
jgi:hypothetical protein